MQEKSKGGRPPRQPEAGERFQVSFRVTPELKQRLDRARKHSGRSQSQEAEHRLEMSFQTADLLSDALALAYGPKLAGLLVLIGDAMQVYGWYSSKLWKETRARGEWMDMTGAYK